MPRKHCGEIYTFLDKGSTEADYCIGEAVLPRFPWNATPQKHPNGWTLQVTEVYVGHVWLKQGFA